MFKRVKSLTKRLANLLASYNCCNLPLIQTHFGMEDYSTMRIPEATVRQNALRSRVDIREQALTINLIAGADVSLNLYSTTIYAGIILLSFPALQPVGWSLVEAE